MKFIPLARLSQEVKRCAAHHGFRNADPFCELPPGLIGSASAELTAATIYIDLNRSIRNAAPTMAAKMCRAVVYSYLREAA